MGHVGQELGLVLAGDFELTALLFDLTEEPGVLDGEIEQGFGLSGGTILSSKRPLPGQYVFRNNGINATTDLPRSRWGVSWATPEQSRGVSFLRIGRRVPDSHSVSSAS